MSYWAQWAWDFPHIAVGVSEAVLAYCATWRLTHRRPKAWEQPTITEHQKWLKTQSTVPPPVDDDIHTVYGTGVYQADGPVWIEAGWQQVKNAPGWWFRP